MMPCVLRSSSLASPKPRRARRSLPERRAPWSFTFYAWSWAFVLLGCAKTPECVAGAERRCPECPSESQVCFENPARWSLCDCPVSHAGEACTGRQDCGTEEICDAPDSSNFLGGAAPGGMCVINCQEDPAACPSGFLCVETLGPGAGAARCLERCTLGSGCTEVAEWVCSSNVAQLGCSGESCRVASGQGMCRPFCVTDSDCAASGASNSSTGNTYCNRQTGVCTDEPTPGEGLGTACGAQLAEVNCAGRCLSGSTYSFCTHSCRFVGEGSEAGWCDFDAADPARPTGYCALPANGQTGPGDEGYCAPLCLDDADCPDGMRCATDYQTARDEGVCQPQSEDGTTNGDPGTGDAGADTASTPTGGDNTDTSSPNPPNVQDASAAPGL